MAPADDVEGFRAFEREGWERVPARYHDAFERLTTQTVPALLDAVSAGPGVRLLDVCCGPGYAAQAARERGAEVVGVDLSSAMLALARARCPGLELRAGDAEALPFEDASFDALVMGYGLLHLARPERALREAHRVLRPGGRLAFAVWAPPERALGFAIVQRALREHGHADVDLPSAPDFFRFADAEGCRRELAAAGFVDASSREVPQVWHLRSPDELFEVMASATVRNAGLLAAQDESARAAVRRAVREELARLGDAPSIPMPAVLTSARRGEGPP